MRHTVLALSLALCLAVPVAAQAPATPRLDLQDEAPPVTAGSFSCAVLHADGKPCVWGVWGAWPSGIVLNAPGGPGGYVTVGPAVEPAQTPDPAPSLDWERLAMFASVGFVTAGGIYDGVESSRAIDAGALEANPFVRDADGVNGWAKAGLTAAAVGASVVLYRRGHRKTAIFANVGLGVLYFWLGSRAKSQRKQLEALR
jgi:hypothetical protein